MKRKISFVLAFALAVCLMAGNAALAACKHQWGYVGTQDPTCTKDGYVEWCCTLCGQTKKDKSPKLGHTWVNTASLPATCTDKGYQYYQCTVCGDTKTETVKAMGHSYVWTTTKAATCTATGSKEGVCSICGKKATEKISKTSHNYTNWSVIAAPTDHSPGKRSGLCSICGAPKTEEFYPDGTLQRGKTKSAAVTELQEMLMELGFLHDKADGIFGQKTEAAVKDFQIASGFEPTGIAYPQTLDALRYAFGNPNGNTPDNDPETETDPETDIDPVTDIVPAGYAKEMQGSGFCSFLHEGEYAVIRVFCEDHLALKKTVETMLSNVGDSEEAQIAGLQVARTLWLNEVNLLYQKLAEAADESARADILNAQAAFVQNLNAQEKLFSACYPDEPVTVRKWVIGMLEDECIQLCLLLSIQSV